MDVYKSEKEQWEDVKTWLRENTAWIVAGVVLGVGIIYGYRYWESRENHRAVEAHLVYGDVLNALYANKKDVALKELGRLDGDFGRTPYGDQARLALARWYVDGGKPGDAIAPLTKIMNDSHDDALRHVARLRIARILAGEGKLDEALKMIDSAPSSGFEPRYQEARGDVLYAKGDRAGALAAYQAAAASKVPAIVDEDELKLKIADLADVSKDKAP
ncbi:MAG: YfgM family protein [Steroidobacteraceae bacterium]